MITNTIPVPSDILMARKTQVEKLYTVTWESNFMGHIECPGYASHNAVSAERDCAVFIDRVPTIVCFHQSCAAEVAAANKDLRKAIREAEANGNPATKPGVISAEQKAWIREKQRQQALRRRAESSLPDILQKYAWTPEQARSESPVPIPEDPLKHWSLFLSLFQDADILWVGDTYHSGDPSHVLHFNPIAEWKEFPVAPFQFTCPSTFKPGSYSRSNEKVLDRRYLVVESDTLQKAEILAVFKWLQLNFKLRAIVDTAGKSLHGWFEYPTPEQLAELKIMLPAMGCDPALFKPSQPCRVPGAWRINKIQSLVWLAGGQS